MAVYKLTIDATQVGGSNLTNYPVAVCTSNSTAIAALQSLFKTTGNGGLVTSASGYDITFWSDAACTSLLTFERAQWSATTGACEFHVLLSSVSASVNTVFYVQIGNAAITTDQQNKTGTWNSNFKGVWHFADGATLALTDSTSTGTTLTNTNGASATTGELDGGAGFVSASSQKLTASASLGFAAQSFSVWVKFTSFANSYNTVMTVNTAGAAYFDLHVKSTGKLACYVQATGNVSYDGTGANTLSTGVWYHLAMTYDSVNGLKGYVNGSLDGSAAANGAHATTANLLEIGQQQFFSPRYVNGVIDESRIQDASYLAGWVTADYNSQKQSSTFLSATVVASISLLGSLGVG